MNGDKRDEFRQRVRQIMDRERSVLNRLEPHLGCVTCRGPLTDGRCKFCDDDGCPNDD